MLVLGVTAFVDVKAAVQQYTALRWLPVVKLLLAIVVLEAGEMSGRLAAQDKVLLLHRLELLQVATEDHGPARKQRRALDRIHGWRDNGDRRRLRRDLFRVHDESRGSFVSVYHSHGIVPASFSLPRPFSLCMRVESRERDLFYREKERSETRARELREKPRRDSSR